MNSLHRTDLATAPNGPRLSPRQAKVLLASQGYHAQRAALDALPDAPRGLERAALAVPAAGATELAGRYLRAAPGVRAR